MHSCKFILFCCVECLCLHYLCLDLLAPLLLLLHLALFGQPLLLLVVVEDGGHVLAGLTCSGVMVDPKHLEQVAVVGLVRVVAYLHRLCVIPTKEENWV